MGARAPSPQSEWGGDPFTSIGAGASLLRAGPIVGFVRHGPRATGVTEADDSVEVMPAAEKDPGRAGWLFGAVTVMPALLAAAWLLPAFPLLLAGRFSAGPMVFMFAPLAAAVC